MNQVRKGMGDSTSPWANVDPQLRISDLCGSPLGNLIMLRESVRDSFSFCPIFQ